MVLQYSSKRWVQWKQLKLEAAAITQTLCEPTGGV